MSSEHLMIQLESQNRTAKDKKQSEFSLKKMIKSLHIKEPAEHVMAILGKKLVLQVGVYILAKYVLY